MNAFANRKRVTKLFLCLLIVFAVCLKVFTFRFGVLDELWEYDFSRAITMGYLPYRDFPDVSMPLFGFVFTIPLLFSRTLFAYRIMTALFFSVMLIVLYSVIEKRTSAGYALCAALFAARFVELATYNMLIMFEALLIICCLRMKNKKTGYFLLGIVTALAPLTKQSSGVILLISVTCLVVWLAVKKDVKNVISVYIAGALIPLLIFLFYLLVTSSFKAFWDCCFFGLFGYAGNNSAINLESTLPMVTIIIAGVAGDLYFWIKKHDTESLVHFVAGIAVISNAIPVFEYYHIVMGGMFFLIPLTYLVKEFAPKIIHINIAPVIAVMIFAVIGFFSYDVLSAPRFSDNWKELRFIPSVGEYDYLEPLIVKKKELEKDGKKVMVFSSSAVIISILDESFSPPYDMFLNGNLGTKDPLDYAKEACGDKNNVIFITTDYNEENWQNPDGILEYVSSHCDPVDSYANWVIYAPKQAV